MIYVLAALLPPIGLLLNGQPFFGDLQSGSDRVLPAFSGWFSIFCCWCRRRHALIAVHVKREQRMHREVVDAIRRHGPPPGYRR